MRYAANEVYCHTADEVKQLIKHRADDSGAYILVSSITPPDDNGGRAEAIVVTTLNNRICYIEADTEDTLRAIIAEAGLNGINSPEVHPDSGE